MEVAGKDVLPSVTPDEILTIAPHHFQLSSGTFPPKQPICQMPSPRRDRSTRP